MFIHDALCDYITCGDTSIPAHELKAAVATFGRVDQNARKTAFQEQFAVSAPLIMQYEDILKILIFPTLTDAGNTEYVSML